jgi:perosamine synthetase
MISHMWPISRGKISHPIATELKDFFGALFSSTEDEMQITRFEADVEKFLEARNVIFYPYARTAIFCILQSLRLPKGTRILMPTITIKPILDVVLDLGLEPVFVDLDPHTGVWEMEQLLSSLRRGPRVALLTYLFGVVPDVQAIINLLQKNKIIVIEDFSQAFNADFLGKKIGTWGDFGVCSTSSTKTLDAYGGALVVVPNNESCSQLRLLRNQLAPPSRKRLLRLIATNLVRNVATQYFVFALVTFPFILLLNRKKSFAVGKFTGERNLEPLKKLPDFWFEKPFPFQAHIGSRELKILKEKDRKRLVVARVYESMEFLSGPRGIIQSNSNYWQFVHIERNAIRLRDYLNSKNIDCATTSLVNLTKLSGYGIYVEAPNTDLLYECGVYIPCYHQLNRRAVEHIRTSLMDFYEQL